MSPTLYICVHKPSLVYACMYMYLYITYRSKRAYRTHGFHVDGEMVLTASVCVFLIDVQCVVGVWRQQGQLNHSIGHGDLILMARERHGQLDLKEDNIQIVY